MTQRSFATDGTEIIRARAIAQSQECVILRPPLLHAIALTFTGQVLPPACRPSTTTARHILVANLPDLGLFSNFNGSTQQALATS